MAYYMAYIGSGIEYVTYNKMMNKDEVIYFLLLGHNPENYTTLCYSMKDCKQEVRYMLGLDIE